MILVPANTLAAGGFEVANSCRFFSGDSPHMAKNQGTPSSTRIYTISFWFKVGDVDGDDRTMFSYGADSDSQYSDTFIQSAVDGYRFRTTIDNANNYTVITNRVIRDPSAWYHAVVAVDTTQGTAANRVKIYINGVQETSLQTANYPSENFDVPGMASGKEIGIGCRLNGNSRYFDGYLAEVAFCDGQALTPTSFGEYDEDSPTIWKPKDFSGDVTFGTNGFYLDFEDSANLGNDANGGTDLTETNLAAADQCIDSPTNNLCTLNPLHMSDPSANYFVDNGNNTLEATNNDVDRLTGATIHPQGIKGYFEFKILTDSNFRVAVEEDGVALTKNNYTALASGQFYGLDSSGHLAYANGGSSATLTSSYISSPSNGNIIGCAFDFTGSNRNVWFHLNGTYGNNGSGVGVPATGAYPGLSVTQLALTKEFEFVFMCNTGGSSSSIGLNFGNGSFDGTAISSAGTNASFGSFEYDVPDGFGPICTKTLNGTYS